MKLDSEASAWPRSRTRTRSSSTRRCWPPARTCAGCAWTAATSTASTTCARSATPTRSAPTPSRPSASCWSAAATSAARWRPRSRPRTARSAAIVMQEDVTLERQFGQQVGGFFQGVLEEHGVEVHGGDELERFEGSDGRVRRVMTKGGLDARLRHGGRRRRRDARRDARPRGRAGARRGGRSAVLVAARDLGARASSPPATSASTTASVHGRPTAHRALGRGLQPGQDRRAQHARPRRGRTTRSPTSSPTSPTGRRWSTWARAPATR